MKMPTLIAFPHSPIIQLGRQVIEYNLHNRENPEIRNKVIKRKRTDQPTMTVLNGNTLKNDDRPGESDLGGGDEAELVGLGEGSSGGGIQGGKVKGPWSPEEDAVLSRLVSKFGARNWSLIARGIPGRSGKSCRLRWCNQLDPCVKRKPFTGNRHCHHYTSVYLYTTL